MCKCLRTVQILSFFWPVFPHTWTKYFYLVNFHHSKYGKLHTRKIRHKIKSEHLLFCETFEISIQHCTKKRSFPLTLSWRRPLSDRNQPIDLLCKSMDWFLLYDNGLRHERVSYFFCKCHQIHRKLRIWSHLMQKHLVETFIFCAVEVLKTKWKTQKKLCLFCQYIGM